MKAWGSWRVYGVKYWFDAVSALFLWGLSRLENDSAKVWLLLGGVVVSSVALDLGVFHRKSHRIAFKEALAESAGWISLALAFNVWVYFALGHGAGFEFFTSYVVEKSLSVDNIFLFLLIFQGLQVPDRLQHKVLFYGVAGALLMRGIFVFGGIALLSRFHWVLFVFGAILFLTAIRTLRSPEHSIEPERQWLLRGIHRFLRVTPEYQGSRFFVRTAGKWSATPLFVALVAVEAADILFAIDSVPAVLAITRDTFIAYSSNVFAILGLRALYFALADFLPRFRFLRHGLAALLIFTSLKMLASDRIRIPIGLSLGVVVGILALMIAASLMWPKRKRRA